MNSMMLIAKAILRREPLAPALDARASNRPDLRGVDGAGGQHHAFTGCQLEAPTLSLEDERDGAVHAIQDLFVTLAVGRITVSRPVRPREAAARLSAEPGHQLVGSGHWHDSKIAVVKPRFRADCNIGRLARGSR